MGLTYTVTVITIKVNREETAEGNNKIKRVAEDILYSAKLLCVCQEKVNC